MDITKKAVEYAEGKVNEILTKAVADAYIEGYKAGYNDREKDLPADLPYDEMEYVDLGLPSGTLWAKDYEKKNDEYSYLTHEEALGLNIPTCDQVKELFDNCKFYYDYVGTKLVTTVLGPNGKIIEFIAIGYKDVVPLKDTEILFWTDCKSKSGNYAAAGKMYRLYSSYGTWSHCEKIEEFFIGYRLPVRQVK